MYLLPCTCGIKHEVDCSQAGMALHCTCGAEVAVPTLRGLERLEQTTSAKSVPAPRRWGKRQGLKFLGVSLTAAAAAGLLFLLITAPRFPQSQIETILARVGQSNDFENASFEQLQHLWQELSASPVAIHDDHSDAEIGRLMMNHHEASIEHRKRIKVALAVTIIGVVIFIAGLMVPNKAPRRS